MAEALTDPERTPTPNPASLRPSLAVTSFGQTDRGRVRPSNEDQFLVAELRKALRVRQSSLPHDATRYSDERGHLFLVADGMGGHAGGERASTLAVGAIEDFVLNTLKWFFRLRGREEHSVLAEFQAALRRADFRVTEEAGEHPDLAGMGTTLTLAYALGADLYVVHAGDSRCYLAREGGLHRLTRDQTLVAELVARGVVAPEDAARHPMRHVITNVVGGSEPGVEVQAHKAELRPGDRLLLCTDGLTEMVSEERIREILHAEPQPEPACRRLVAEANERGGKDNITVVLAVFGEAGSD
jgi:protein phosphatase